MGAEPRASVDTVFTHYFAGESQHGTFGVLVSCRRTGSRTCFEVEDVAVVVKKKGVEILQIPAFTVTENAAEDPNDPLIEPTQIQPCRRSKLGIISAKIGTARAAQKCGDTKDCRPT